MFQASYVTLRVLTITVINPRIQRIKMSITNCINVMSEKRELIFLEKEIIFWCRTISILTILFTSRSVFFCAILFNFCRIISICPHTWRT